MNRIFNRLRVLDKYAFILIGCLFLISLVVYKNFFFGEELYIYSDIGSDTLNSYWPFLSYISEMLWSGNFSFWAFSLGTGNNIFSISSILFDPFNWILILFGKAKLPFLLPYIAALKNMIAGYLFYNYLNVINISKKASMIISLIYGFNGFIVLWGQHYHFATLMVITPLVLYGFELFLQQSKKRYFVLSVACLAIYSYYFLFMFSIYLFIYAIFRYIELNKFNVKYFLKTVAKSFILYFCGICLSAVVLFPSIYVVLNSPRISTNKLASVFSIPGTIEYITMIFRFLSNDMLGTGTRFVGFQNYYESPILYSGIFCLVILPCFFIYSNKKNRIIYGAFSALLLLFLAFPFFSYMFNFFSARSYRWTFVLILFICFLAARALDMIVEKNEYKVHSIYYLFFIFGGLFTIVYSLIHFNLDNRIVKQLIALFTIISLLFVCYFFILKSFHKFKGKVSIVGILVIFIVVELSSFSYLTVNKNRTLLNKEILNQKQGYNDYTVDAWNYIKNNDKEAYRIDKTYDSIFLNDSLMQGYAGVKGYNSLNHPSYIEFLKTLEVPFKRRNHLNYLTGLDSRRELYALLSVKYIFDKENIAPDKLNLINKTGDVSIWESKYYLPFGYTYDTVIDYEDFIKLPSYEKDAALMNAFVMDKGQEESGDFSEFYRKGLTFKKVNLLDKVSKIVNAQQDNLNVVEGISLRAENIDPQIVVAFDNLLSTRTSNISITVDSPSDTELQIFWAKGFQFKEVNSKKINIKKGEGTYQVQLDNVDFDSIRIDPTNEKKDVKVIKAELSYVEFDMDEFLKDSKKLSEESLQLDRFTNDYIRGNINVKNDKMLFLSIPYDVGWKARVNGIDVPIKKINIGFMGIPLEGGNHTIEVSYDPPFLKLGLYTSFATSILLLIWFFFSRKKRGL